MDDNSKTQTKEAEQTGETTITDSNADKQQPPAAAPAVEAAQPPQQMSQKDATQQALEQAQADVMKALNAKGNGQTDAEKAQAEQMIK